MCGIAGIYNYRNMGGGNPPVDEKILRKMTGLLYHRGPDDEGYFVNHDVGLGIRRLSIIDLNTGHQPIHNEDKTIYVVLNGEIYNYRDLKEKLTLSGHTFYTASTTETIVHLYEEYGVDCLKFLRGMFAFALWDGNKKQLFVARDRIGEKPLLYMETDGRFYFSSELKSLLPLLPQSEKEINCEALHYYFSYIYVPAPLSIFKKIKKVPPASYMIVSETKGVEIKEYWRCDYGRKIENLSDEEYCARYKGILLESVKEKMASDVPLGVLLSGGVDSSSVLAAISELGFGSENLKTFTVGYEGDKTKDDPEFIRARKVAALFGAKHIEIIFEPKGISVLPEVLSFYDEPINLFPIVYTYEMMKHVKKYVKVVLSGNGADELFGGYYGYNQILMRNYLYEVFKFVPHLFFFTARGKKLSEISRMPAYKRRAEEFRRGAQALAANLYSPRFREEIKDTDIGKPMEDWFLRANSPSEYLDGIMNMDLMLYHSHGHTIMPDMSGMANSLEIRSPFLDHRMVEFAAALPMRMKLHSVFNRRFNKYIMKKSFEGVLPRDILYGRKMGFGYSIKWTHWLRSAWAKSVRKILLEESSAADEYFNKNYITKIFEENATGRREHSSLIWGLLVFKLWYKIYLEGQDPNEISELLKA